MKDMAKTRFLPCKILDKKWADKLLDGEVFMRPLSEFGSWMDSPDVNDDNRKDIMEGAVAVFDNPDDFEPLKGLDPEFKKIIGSVSLIDYTELQYFKVFCMYCLDVVNNEPVKPDPQIRGFGDTVVVFRDFNSFLVRFFKAASKVSGSEVVLLDRIRYYTMSENRKLQPLFEKTSDYMHQKELRLAYCQSEVDKFAIGDPENAYALILDKNRITINVGDIRDIAYAIPMEQFLNTSGINGRHSFPCVGNIKAPYDFLLDKTREEMKNYKSFIVKPMFTIM